MGPFGREGFVLPSLLLFLFSLGLDGLASGLGGALVGGKVPLPVFGSFFLSSTVSECPFFSLPWSFFCPFSFLLALGLPCVPFLCPLPLAPCPEWSPLPSPKGYLSGQGLSMVSFRVYQWSPLPSPKGYLSGQGLSFLFFPLASHLPIPLFYINFFLYILSQRAGPPFGGPFSLFHFGEVCPSMLILGLPTSTRCPLSLRPVSPLVFHSLYSWSLVVGLVPLLWFFFSLVC